MSQFIYTMKGLGKTYPPDSVVFQDIWLSFLYGAKIGVIGVERRRASRRCSGSWRASITEFQGEATLSAGLHGRLPVAGAAARSRRRPCSATSRRASRRSRALLTRFDEINAKFGEEMSPEEMEKVLEEQARVQDAIEAAGAWDLDSKLEHAMDALRLPPADADVDEALGRRAAPRRAVPAAAAVARPAAARRADQPSRRRVGRLARALPARSTRARSSRSRTTATSSTTSPTGSSSSTARARFRGKATTRAGSSRSSSGSRSRRSSETKRQRTLAARARLDPHVAARAPGQGQGAPERVRAAARRGHGREDRSRRDLHPARPAARRRRRRGARPAQGLRRRAADGRPDVHAAARRHRRRHRPERRRQDDAVPDARRAGDSRTPARSRSARPCRSATSISRASRSIADKTVWEEISGGEDELVLGKKTINSRAYVSWFNFRGPRPAAEGRHAVGRPAQPRCTWRSCCSAAATCCCSTSRPTTSTSTRCARSRKRCSISPAAPSSSRTTAGSSTASRRTSSRSKATATSSGSQGNFQDYEADKKRRLGRRRRPAASDQVQKTHPVVPLARRPGTRRQSRLSVPVVTT